jgi:uncharacterized protein
MENHFEFNKGRLARFGVVFFLALTFFVIILSVKALKEFHYIGYDPGATKNMITVHGEGEAFAVPDVATFTFTISEDAATVAAAQAKMNEKMKSALAVVKDAGIEDKDVKTVDYSVYPKYEYQATSGAASTAICIDGNCPIRKQVLVGYTVTQSIQVKIRKTDSVGDVLTKVAATGISNVSGVDFTIDDQKKIESDARASAITDAKGRAQTLAAQLGVRLVRIVSFSESGNYPYPIYDKAISMSAGIGGAAAAPTQLPVGQNKITSNVDITYEIH